MLTTFKKKIQSPTPLLIAQLPLAGVAAAATTTLQTTGAEPRNVLPLHTHNTNPLHPPFGETDSSFSSSGKSRNQHGPKAATDT
jgi:hypothetical protein